MPPSHGGDGGSSPPGDTCDVRAPKSETRSQVGAGGPRVPFLDGSVAQRQSPGLLIRLARVRVPPDPLQTEVAWALRLSVRSPDFQSGRGGFDSRSAYSRGACVGTGARLLIEKAKVRFLPRELDDHSDVVHHGRRAPNPHIATNDHPTALVAVPSFPLRGGCWHPSVVLSHAGRRFDSYPRSFVPV